MEESPFLDKVELQSTGNQKKGHGVLFSQKGKRQRCGKTADT